MPALNAQTSDAALDAQVFWVRHRTEIAAAIVVLLLAVIAIAGWRFARERRETAASAAFAAAKTAGDYQRVISRYDGTPAAAGAYLLLAEDQRNAGKLADANATLQRFIDKFPHHELLSTARMSMAANLDAMGKHDEAVAAYQQIASTDPGSFNAPLALIAEAQILQAQKRDGDARRVCETVMTQYGRTYAAAEAAQMLRSLKPPPAQPPNAPRAATPGSVGNRQPAPATASVAPSTSPAKP
ncbi:MAG: tetratricopeptide repeat protein [Verrucomicrobia bacterium]|nr:tetratricopeptide repeat protein [Verrucomicrobiota bacterium]